VNLPGLLLEMVERGGSDLHLMVGRPPLVRMKDGFLHPLREERLSRPLVDRAISDVFKGASNAAARLFSREEIDTTFSCQAGRFRVNIALSEGQPFLVLRELKSDIPEPAELGIPEAFVQAAENAPYGIAMLVGSTGSGKSTTMASVVNHILKRKAVRVITIEDPIEYLLGREGDAVSQREVGKDTLSFANALRSAMREDPDIIVVGEVRDMDTARQAIIASETGHLVFVTVHASNVLQAVNRFVGIFPFDEQRFLKRRLVDSLLAIMAQRLIPSKDGKKRYLASELLIPDHEVRNMLFNDELERVREMIAGGSHGHSLSTSIRRLVERGVISEEYRKVSQEV